MIRRGLLLWQLGARVLSLILSSSVIKDTSTLIHCQYSALVTSSQHTPADFKILSRGVKWTQIGLLLLFFLTLVLHSQGVRH